MIVYMNVVVTVPCHSVWDPRMRYSVFIRPSFPNTDICIIIQMAQNAQKVCAVRHFASLKWNITNRLERPVSFLCSGLNLMPFFCTIFFSPWVNTSEEGRCLYWSNVSVTGYILNNVWTKCSPCTGVRNTPVVYCADLSLSLGWMWLASSSCMSVSRAGTLAKQAPS